MTSPAEQPTGARMAAAFKRCDWCNGFASDVRTVAATDQGSGPQQPPLSACPRHREQHGLTPLVGQS